MGKALWSDRASDPARAAKVWVDRGKHRAAAGPSEGAADEAEGRKVVSLKPWPGPVPPWRPGESGRLP